MPQGTMPSKWARSGSTLSEMPWSVTQRFTRMPMAAILSLGLRALVGALHPDADAILAPLAAHVEGVQRADDPVLQRRDEDPEVALAAVEVEHDIGHPLARPVIGHLPAAAGLEDGESRIDTPSALAEVPEV